MYDWISGLTVAVVVAGHGHGRDGSWQASSQQMLVDSRNASGAGVWATVVPGDGGGVSFSMSDGHTTASLTTDVACTAALGHQGKHFVAFVADAGPRILTVLVDGVLCDGAGVTPRGWAFFEALGSVRGASRTRIGGLGGLGGEAQANQLLQVQMYTRALLTSELVGNYRAAVAPSAEFDL